MTKSSDGFRQSSANHATSPMSLLRPGSIHHDSKVELHEIELGEVCIRHSLPRCCFFLLAQWTKEHRDSRKTMQPYYAGHLRSAATAEEELEVQEEAAVQEEERAREVGRRSRSRTSTRRMRRRARGGGGGSRGSRRRSARGRSRAGGRWDEGEGCAMSLECTIL
jgi:hypothetical protein